MSAKAQAEVIIHSERSLTMGISARLSGSAVNVKVSRFEPIADAAEFAAVLIA